MMADGSTETSLVARQLITAQGLCVAFGGDPVIDHVDLTIHAGEIVTVIGPNGSGKTTLVRALMGLVAPKAGTVERADALTIGYVPQLLSVDATLPLTVRRFLALGTTAKEVDMRAALDEVGITGAIDQAVQTLSGGQMRRVLLARALLRDPDLLVLDEPTSGVDFTGQAELYDLIRRIRDRRQCGVLMISHNLHLVMAATDRVVCLNHHICCEGLPDSVSRNPAYLDLFGHGAAAAVAVYTHQHDHEHDLTGAAIEPHDHAHHDHSPENHEGENKGRHDG
jgi:zinc transport system ATP-binding protein